MKIREAKTNDLKQIAELSIYSFDHSDIMWRMGSSYLEHVFFPSMMDSSLSKLVVAEENGHVLGYCGYFSDFEAFYKKFNRAKGRMINYGYALLAVFRLRLSINDILNVLYNHDKVMRFSGVKAHFGPAALAPEVKSTPRGGFIILSLSREVLRLLRVHVGTEACWGVADYRNVQSQKLMELLKFERIGKIKLFGRIDYVYLK